MACSNRWRLASWSVSSFLSIKESAEVSKQRSWLSGSPDEVTAGLGKTIPESTCGGCCPDAWPISDNPAPGKLLVPGSELVLLPKFAAESTAVRASRRHGSIGKDFFSLGFLPLSSMSVDSSSPKGEPSESVVGTAIPSPIESDEPNLLSSFRHPFLESCLHKVVLPSKPVGFPGLSPRPIGQSSLGGTNVCPSAFSRRGSAISVC